MFFDTLAAAATASPNAVRVRLFCGIHARCCTSLSAVRTLRLDEATRDDWATVLTVLAPFAHEQRLMKMRDILAKRRAGLHVVLEDVSDPFDVAAVLRTAEGLGVQHIHLIQRPRPPSMRAVGSRDKVGGARSPRGERRQNRNRDKRMALTSVAMGAARWLTVKEYSSSAACYEQLQALGLVVFAACPPPATGGGVAEKGTDHSAGVQPSSATPIGELPFSSGAASHFARLLPRHICQLPQHTCHQPPPASCLRLPAASTWPPHPPHMLP